MWSHRDRVVWWSEFTDQNGHVVVVSSAGTQNTGPQPHVQRQGLAAVTRVTETGKFSPKYNKWTFWSRGPCLTETRSANASPPFEDLILWRGWEAGLCEKFSLGLLRNGVTRHASAAFFLREGCRCGCNSHRGSILIGFNETRSWGECNKKYIIPVV